MPTFAIVDAAKLQLETTAGLRAFGTVCLAQAWDATSCSRPKAVVWGAGLKAPKQALSTCAALFTRQRWPQAAAQIRSQTYQESRSVRPFARAELFRASLMHGRRIGDPWRQAFLLAQALICYAGYEALMGRDESAEAMVAECEAEMAKIGGDKLYVGHGRALLGTIAIRRGHFERAGQLLAESLALYRSVESKFDIAGSLAQQGFLALRQNDPARALALFRESLPLHRNYATSPGVTRGLAQMLIAYAACKEWRTAARLAGVLNGTSATDADACAAPVELSGAVRQAYELALASTRSALDRRAFVQQVKAGRSMRREHAIEYAMVGEASSPDE